MALVTTGSTLFGLAKGMGKSLVGSIVAPAIFYVYGNPDTYVTCVNGSDIAIDTTNKNYYISKVKGGSTWYSLGSTT